MSFELLENRVEVSEVLGQSKAVRKVNVTLAVFFFIWILDCLNRRLAQLEFPVVIFCSFLLFFSNRRILCQRKHLSQLVLVRACWFRIVFFSKDEVKALEGVLISLRCERIDIRGTSRPSDWFRPRLGPSYMQKPVIIFDVRRHMYYLIFNGVLRCPNIFEKSHCPCHSNFFLMTGPVHMLSKVCCISVLKVA